MWALVALLALTTLASLGHNVTVAARGQVREHLALRAIGFTPGQVHAAVGWEALVPLVIALVVALPVGIAAGRWAWRLLAGVVGIIDVVAVVPVGSLLLVVVGALVGAVLVSIRPGRRAAAIGPAAPT